MWISKKDYEYLCNRIDRSINMLRDLESRVCTHDRRLDSLTGKVDCLEHNHDYRGNGSDGKVVCTRCKKSQTFAAF